MSKDIKNNTLTKLSAGLVPKLRFKEFLNSGDWILGEFSEYVKLYRGSSPRPIQSYLTTESNGVNWIKIGDTKCSNNFIIENVEERITTEGASKSRKVQVGELILANSMSFGKTYLLAINGYIYDGWFVLREYERDFDKQFLFQLLNSDYMQSQYKKLSAGGIVQNISSDIVYKTTLPHTSKKEQQKIADCLSSLDNLITAQSKKIEALKEHKKGLLQGLFPKLSEL
ncbi:MAG: restriction endonuclease subunit S [Melioribacter sp.]|nr:restriction endonuclease subunit S [Melioribacter sp.]